MKTFVKQFARLGGGGGGGGGEVDLPLLTPSTPSLSLLCLCVFIQKKLNTIGDRLNKVTVHQNFFKARESRHRHTVESNHVRVFWWSFLEISVIVTVGIMQVGGKQRINGE